MAGIMITSRSVFDCESVRIVPTGESASVCVALDFGTPRYVERKLHASADGRLFVAWQHGFAEVVADGFGGYDMLRSGHRFVRGLWHRNEFNELVPGHAPEPAATEKATGSDDAEHGYAENPEEATHGDAAQGAPATAEVDEVGDVEFSLYDLFFGDGACE